MLRDVEGCWGMLRVWRPNILADPNTCHTATPVLIIQFTISQPDAFAQLLGIENPDVESPQAGTKKIKF